MNHINFELELGLGVASDFRHFVDILLDQSSFGICGGKARITDVKAG